MMDRWGLEGMESFKQERVARKELPQFMNADAEVAPPPVEQAKPLQSSTLNIA